MRPFLLGASADTAPKCRVICEQLDLIAFALAYPPCSSALCRVALTSADNSLCHSRGSPARVGLARAMRLDEAPMSGREQVGRQVLQMWEGKELLI